MVTAPLSWSYTSELLPAVRLVESLLDMDTGGGEFLAGLQPLPAHTCATEGYAPNIPIARQRLEPLGVTVVETGEDDLLPFADGEFDLVINRHGSFLSEEVFRVLNPGGRFVTQQVGGSNDWGLNEMLGAEPNRQWENWTLAFFTSLFGTWKRPGSLSRWGKRPFRSPAFLMSVRSFINSRPFPGKSPTSR